MRKQRWCLWTAYRGPGRGICLICGLLGSLEMLADTVGGSVLILCHGLKGLGQVLRWRRCPVAQTPSATHGDPAFHLSSYALDADWGGRVWMWKYQPFALLLNLLSHLALKGAAAMAGFMINEPERAS